MEILRIFGVVCNVTQNAANEIPNTNFDFFIDYL